MFQSIIVVVKFAYLKIDIWNVSMSHRCPKCVTILNKWTWLCGDAVFFSITSHFFAYLWCLSCKLYSHNKNGQKLSKHKPSGVWEDRRTDPCVHFVIMMNKFIINYDRLGFVSDFMAQTTFKSRWCPINRIVVWVVPLEKWQINFV